MYFTNYADQRLWRLTPGKAPQPITAESKLRFADFVHDAPRNRLIAVCEDHTQDDHEPANRIVAVSLADGKVTTLVEGADFYSNPRISPDGKQLAWLAWNHPNMPWDGTELFVAPIAERWLARPAAQGRRRRRGIDLPTQLVAGRHAVFRFRSHELVESVRRARIRPAQDRPVLPMDAEFGAPQWVFGTTTYGFQPDGTIIARYAQGGKWNVMRHRSAIRKARADSTAVLEHFKHRCRRQSDVLHRRLADGAGVADRNRSRNRQVASDPPQLAD